MLVCLFVPLLNALINDTLAVPLLLPLYIVEYNYKLKRYSSPSNRVSWSLSHIANKMNIHSRGVCVPGQDKLWVDIILKGSQCQCVCVWSYGSPGSVCFLCWVTLVNMSEATQRLSLPARERERESDHKNGKDVVWSSEAYKWAVKVEKECKRDRERNLKRKRGEREAESIKTNKFVKRARFFDLN